MLLVYLKNVLMGRALLRYSIEKLYIEIKNPYAGEGAVRDGLHRTVRGTVMGAAAGRAAS